MSESTARQLLASAGTSAVVLYIITMWLGLRGDTELAAFTLLLALIDSGLAWFFYKRYTRLRQARWDSELHSSNERMGRLLQEEGSVKAEAQGDRPSEGAGNTRPGT